MVLELVEVEELPPVFAAEEVRLEMSSRFKLEGNEKFVAGDYPRLVSVRGVLFWQVLREENQESGGGDVPLFGAIPRINRRTVGLMSR